MSAVPPISTELMRHNETSLGATSGLVRCSNIASLPRLVDHLVGSREQRWRDYEAKRSCRLQINGKFEFHRLLYRQVRRLLSFYEFSALNAGAARQCPKTR